MTTKNGIRDLRAFNKKQAAAKLAQAEAIVRNGTCRDIHEALKNIRVYISEHWKVHTTGPEPMIKEKGMIAQWSEEMYKRLGHGLWSLHNYYLNGGVVRGSYVCIDGDSEGMYKIAIFARQEDEIIINNTIRIISDNKIPNKPLEGNYAYHAVIAIIDPQEDTVKTSLRNYGRVIKKKNNSGTGDDIILRNGRVHDYLIQIKDKASELGDYEVVMRDSFGNEADSYESSNTRGQAYYVAIIPKGLTDDQIRLRRHFDESDATKYELLAGIKLKEDEVAFVDE